MSDPGKNAYEELREHATVLRIELALTESERQNYLGEYRRLLALVKQVRTLHTAFDDDGARRCSACVVGYDPKGGRLMYAAWPCHTIAIVGDRS